MANADVISAVSSTLQARLTAALAPLGTSTATAPVAQLHDLIDDPSTDPPTVTLFLYQVLEDASVRNRPATTRVVGGTLRTLKQPLGLCLQYMVTAWGGDRDTEHRMLGRVLRSLHDDAILDGLELRGVLAATPARLNVNLQPLELEDRARVWSAIRRTYRLSVNYEVRVVNVDAETETGGPPVRQREVAQGMLT